MPAVLVHVACKRNILFHFADYSQFWSDRESHEQLNVPCRKYSGWGGGGGDRSAVLLHGLCCFFTIIVCLKCCTISFITIIYVM